MKYLREANRKVTTYVSFWESSILFVRVLVTNYNYNSHLFRLIWNGSTMFFILSLTSCISMTGDVQNLRVHSCRQLTDTTYTWCARKIIGLVRYLWRQANLCDMHCACVASCCKGRTVLACATSVLIWSELVNVVWVCRRIVCGRGNVGCIGETLFESRKQTTPW